ncbi:MAG: hypothetical protein H8E44_04515 [Planctomycetes bacterium]|nr:hypothetical protein [Planctomycetota bacterium]MBL7038472.1 hypothetical protein [Pirellulaceae bacterium]
MDRYNCLRFTLRHLLLIVLACGLVIGGGRAAFQLYGPGHIEQGQGWLILTVAACYSVIGAAIGYVLKRKSGAAIGAMLGFIIAVSPCCYLVWHAMYYGHSLTMKATHQAIESKVN